MEYLKEIKTLREKYPMGAKQAEKLLIESDGDVIQAECRFKKNQVDIFMQKESLNEEQAVQFLETANYDIGIAIQRLETAKYSTTELCLLKNKNKEDALDKVLYAINEKYDADFWLCWEKQCPKTHAIEYPFIVLMEWINYESWEGDIIISPTVAQACHDLKIQWLEDLLNNAIKRIDEVEKIWEDKTYVLLNESFLKRRSELIDILYEYVKKNITIFP